MLQTLPVDDLFSIVKMDELSHTSHQNALLQIVENYHHSRDFNLYEWIITQLYVPSYSLGKTKITLGGSKLRKTLFLIDTLTRYEADSQSVVPDDHAKYLFAFIKEFLTLVKEWAQKPSVQNGFSELTTQLEWVKKIVSKQKNNADVLVAFENTIEMIKKANPLFLPSGDTLPASGEKKSLNTSLSKLSKKVFTDMFKLLNDYTPEDYYKLVSYAYSKYDRDVFREAKTGNFPLFVTAMQSPNERLDGIDFLDLLVNTLGEIARNVQEGEILSFYPLPCKTFDELKDVAWSFMDGLVTDEIITCSDSQYVKYRALRAFKKLNADYINELAQLTESLIGESVHIFSLFSLSKLSELDNRKMRYDNYLFLLGQNYSSSHSFDFDMPIKEGKITKLIKPHQIEVKSPYIHQRSTYEDNENYEETELEIFADVLKIIRELRPFYELVQQNGSFSVSVDSRVTFSPNLIALILKMESEVFLRMQVDLMKPEQLKSMPVDVFRGDSGFFKLLVAFRVNFKLLHDEEIKILFGSEQFLSMMRFSDLNENYVINYLERALELGCFDLTLREQQAMFLDFKFNNEEKRKNFIHQIFGKYDEDLVRFIESMVIKNDDDSHESFQKRKTDAVYRFYQNRKTQRKRVMHF